MNTLMTFIRIRVSKKLLWWWWKLMKRMRNDLSVAKVRKTRPALVGRWKCLYLPVQSGHEGQAEGARPLVELLQEAVHQRGSLAGEALLQRGVAAAMQRPEQLPPAEEGLVAEEGHHVCWLESRLSFGAFRPRSPALYTPAPHLHPGYFRAMISQLFSQSGDRGRNAPPLIHGLKAAHAHILFGFVCWALEIQGWCRMCLRTKNISWSHPILENN